MKLRFYPKKDVALNMVRERVSAASAEVTKSMEALDAYDNSQSSGIVTDPFGTKKAGLLAEHASRDRYFAEQTNLMLLLESHSAPEVLVEVEI